jgi:hypothetical protein
MTAAAVAWVGTGKVADGSGTTSLGGASLATNTDSYIEGSSSASEKVSATTIVAAFSGASITGEPFDLSSTSADREHIFVWIQATGASDTLANGGMGIVVIDDLATDSVGQWYVGPRTGYVGGWVPYVIDPNLAFDAVTAGSASWTTGGNPGQLTGVDAIGCRWKITNTIMGASDNCYIDAVSIGLGYVFTLGDAGSTECAFSDLITFEQNASNRYGGMVSRDGILFMQSRIYIGASSGTTNTEFIDDGFTIIFSYPETPSGSAVASTFYAFICQLGTGTTTVSLSNGSISAVSPTEFYAKFSGVTSVTLANLSIDRARLIDLDANCSWDGGLIKNSGQIDLGGAPTFTNLSILSPTDADALKIDATTELANVSNIAFDGAGVGGSGSSAILLTPNGGTYNFDNITFANRVSGSHDVRIPNTTTADTTINVLNGGSTPTVNNQGTGAVTIVTGSVTATLTVTTAAGTPIQSARVMVKAAAGGGLPYNGSVSISNSGTTATVTHTAHGMASGDKVLIRFVSDTGKIAANEGIFTITKIDANSYSYTMGSAPGSSPTGTIYATYVLISGDTDVNGQISTTRSFSVDQPISGWARKSSAAPFYKTGAINGTVDKDTGASLSAVLVADE